MPHLQEAGLSDAIAEAGYPVGNPIDPIGPIVARVREALHPARQSRVTRKPALALVGDAPSPPMHTPAPLRVAVALSGGLDSIVLLDALACCAARDASLDVAVFHIHHGLAVQADDWLQFCASETEMRGLAFAARRVEVPRNARQGVEGAARAARYDALAELCALHDVDALFTAHHADDQAETVLLQLLRGAGLPGVAAMPATGVLPGQDNDRTVLMRPLLDLPREALQAYAEGRALRWVEDPSNADTRHLRNGLRHDVMPALMRHVPASRETLGRFARHAAQAQSLLDQLAALDWEVADFGDGMLRRSVIQGLDAARVANLLRYWARRIGLPTPSESRLDEWVKQVRGAADGASLELPHGHGVLRLYRDALQWVPRNATIGAEVSPVEQTLRWQGEAQWHLPAWRGCVHFMLSQAGMPGIPESCLREQPLTARARAGGERWRAHVGGHSRLLRHWFQSKGVPAWRRQGPILWMRDKIVFVPHLGIDGAWLSEKCSPGERTWTIRWHDDATALVPAR